MSKDVLYDVPFVPNVNNRCAVAVNAMILGYFEPDVKFTQVELDKFSGYLDDLGSWAIESALNFAKRGYDIEWIEDFDFKKFAKDAVGYMCEIFKDKDQIEYQLSHSDIPAEQARAQEYLAQKLPFKKRTGTLEDIRRLLDGGYLIKLEVNGPPLAGKEGYCGHNVLAIGYSDNKFIIHNPDDVNGSQPNQRVGAKLLLRSWKEFGGSFGLQAFRKK